VEALSEMIEREVQMCNSLKMIAQFYVEGVQ
jgi:hypothetical protein